MNLFKRVKLSFQARVVRPYMQNHFEKNKYGKQIFSLKNKYKGKKCFFIGNGPSLKASDLDIIKKNDIPTFAFNRIYNIFDQTNWQPTFYISQDEKMLQGCADVVDKLDLQYKFIPIQLKWYFDINIHDAIYFNMIGQQCDNPEELKFSKDIPHGIFNAGTCMYTAAQLAIYMGFTEIYLIGVDHHFQISQNNKGEIIVDNSVKDYFTDKYNEDKNNLYIPNTEKSTLTYVAMKKNCDELGIKIYNATRGGKLEVFPRVSFDEIIKSER